MSKKLNFSAPPSMVDIGLPFIWLKWFDSIFNRVGSGPLKIEGYSVSSLPTASNPTPASDWGSLVSGSEFSSVIFVYDETGGATLAFSDGTNWRRATDLTIVS